MQSKITKETAIVLFVVAFLMDVSVFTNTAKGQKADVSLSNVEVSLFQKAYANENGANCSGSADGFLCKETDIFSDCHFVGCSKKTGHRNFLS